MKNGNLIIKGDICWSRTAASIETRKDAYLVCVDGVSAGVFSVIPGLYKHLPLADYSGKLVLPGFTDLHVHAPQFAFRALGMDKELLDWLEQYAFPEEARYASLAYAEQAYRIFVDHIRNGPNTRLAVFATVHTEATLLLMDMLEESGLISFVGKVSMDRNSPDSLREQNAQIALNAARVWLEECARRGWKNTKPILTPRFIPSCSDTLMDGLAQMQRHYQIPVQSHLSENRKEVRWVRELCPNSSGYGAAYADFGLFGGSVPTIMAHCVWSDNREIELLAGRGVYVAHCPQSNANLSSGIAPVCQLLEAGVPVGLGSDIAGGAHSSIGRAVSDAIQVSKLRAVLLESDKKPLSLEEAFYLGTRGGGAFFGNTGTFEAGSEVDAVIYDDTPLAAPRELSLHNRLERIIYLADSSLICAKYVRGAQVMLNSSQRAHSKNTECV